MTKAYCDICKQEVFQDNKDSKTLFAGYFFGFHLGLTVRKFLCMSAKYICPVCAVRGMMTLAWSKGDADVKAIIEGFGESIKLK